MEIKMMVTDSAIRQIHLMQTNDYTLEGLTFRVKIGGKGCEGFTFETGFSEKHSDDLVVTQFVSLLNFELNVLVDPFTAFYTPEFTLDYLLETTTGEEGFIVKSATDGQHRGKFFKDTSKLPPWAAKL